MEENELPSHCEANKFPSQGVFNLGDVKLTSNFDSGNLMNVKPIFPNQIG